MPGRIEGKVAMVTGGASGIGEAVVRRFHTEGALSCIADVDGERGRALAEELGERTFFQKADVTSEAAMAAAVDATVRRYGRLDVMVNNAGIVGAAGSIAQMSLEDWRKTMDIHVTGTFLGTKYAARVMISQRSGCIISMSSAAGSTGGLGPHAYTAAKHAIVGITKSVASELAPYGIRVNAIAPGGTITPLTVHAFTGDASRVEEARMLMEQAMMAPLGTVPTADDPAAAILFLASDEAQQISGHVLAVDGGVTTAGFRTALHETGPQMIARNPVD